MTLNIDACAVLYCEPQPLVPSMNLQNSDDHADDPQMIHPFGRRVGTDRQTDCADRDAGLRSGQANCTLYPHACAPPVVGIRGATVSAGLRVRRSHRCIGAGADAPMLECVLDTVLDPRASPPGRPVGTPNTGAN